MELAKTDGINGVLAGDCSKARQERSHGGANFSKGARWIANLVEGAQRRLLDANPDTWRFERSQRTRDVLDQAPGPLHVIGLGSDAKLAGESVLGVLRGQSRPHRCWDIPRHPWAMSRPKDGL